MSKLKLSRIILQGISLIALITLFIVGTNHIFGNAYSITQYTFFEYFGSWILIFVAIVISLTLNIRILEILKVQIDFNYNIVESIIFVIPIFFLILLIATFIENYKGPDIIYLNEANLVLFVVIVLTLTMISQLVITIILSFKKTNNKNIDDFDKNIERLNQLKELFDQVVITKEQFEDKRKIYIDNL